MVVFISKFKRRIIFSLLDRFILLILNPIGKGYRTHLRSLSVTISLLETLSPKMFQNNWLKPHCLVRQIKISNFEITDFS